MTTFDDEGFAPVAKCAIIDEGIPVNVEPSRTRGDTVELRIHNEALAFNDLRLRCFALGTMNTPEQLASSFAECFVRLDMSTTLVAVALNEYLVDIV